MEKEMEDEAQELDKHSLMKHLMTKEQEEMLVNARYAAGIYTPNELRTMFADPVTGKPMSRYSLDYAMNSGKLAYMSNNNRNRYIKLKDFLEFMERNANEKFDVYKKELSAPENTESSRIRCN